jgi:hypothetical protein
MPKRYKHTSAVDEVRRHSWLRDQYYELDHGPERRAREPVHAPSSGASPVNVTVNVNLGDIVDKVMRGMHPKEALEEAIQYAHDKRQQLSEHGDG